MSDLTKDRAQGSDAPGLAEMYQIIAGLAADVETAKDFANSHINFLCEIHDQEKEELHLQVSVLQNELGELKQQYSGLSDELLKEQKEKILAQQEIKSISIQSNQLERELEHYFLLSSKQSDLLHSSAKLQQRSVHLLASVID